MDFLSGVDGSDSESSADEAVGDVPPVRLHLAVGQHQLIPSFSGGCVASQLVGKGQVTRGAAVLCGGVGRDRYLWGRWLGSTLSSLGADIANLSVTRIRGDDNHVQYAASGTGFLAVSHGAQYVARTWADMQTLNTCGQLGWPLQSLKIFLVTVLMHSEILSGTLSSGVVLRVSQVFYRGLMPLPVGSPMKGAWFPTCARSWCYAGIKAGMLSLGSPFALVFCLISASVPFG